VSSGAPDVVVLGSGAAGLAAALAASEGGAEVLLLERSDWVGGTTAISGGVVWAPGNSLMADAGIADSEADAVRYLNRIDKGGDPALQLHFVTDAARVIRLIEDRTAIRWKLLREWPDYHSEEPGGRPGGRSIWPAPIELTPEIAAMVQPSPETKALDRGPSQVETAHLHTDSAGGGAPANDGVVFKGPVRGRVLVGALVSELCSRGVDVRRSSRVTRLMSEEGRVSGVLLGSEEIRARVVVATGGFQHDPVLASDFLRTSDLAPMGPPGCSGDGLRMTMSAGAALGDMSEGWWMPAMHVDHEALDGSVFYRPLHSERAQPGALMVDRRGNRFMNEAQNYGDAGRAMKMFEPEPGSFPALRCWLLFDSSYRTRTPIGPLQPSDPDPVWLLKAQSVGELAQAIGVEEGVLGATIRRFNENARRGEDPDFDRGVRHYDRWIGDSSTPHQTLGGLLEAPFYALEVRCGCMGTKGGPRTDEWGRVLSAGGGVIEGLYAAGNAAANPFGSATPAGGSTIGPALVFGTRAGEAAASDRVTRR